MNAVVSHIDDEWTRLRMGGAFRAKLASMCTSDGLRTFDLRKDVPSELIKTHTLLKRLTSIGILPGGTTRLTENAEPLAAFMAFVLFHNRSPTFPCPSAKRNGVLAGA